MKILEKILESIRPAYNLQIQLKGDWNMISKVMGYEDFMNFVLKVRDYQGNFAVYKDNDLSRNVYSGVETKTAILDIGDLGNLSAIKKGNAVNAYFSDGKRISYNKNKVAES